MSTIYPLSFQVMSNPEHIEGILAGGAARADAIASQSLLWTKDAMGFYIPGTTGAGLASKQPAGAGAEKKA